MKNKELMGLFVVAIMITIVVGANSAKKSTCCLNPALGMSTANASDVPTSGTAMPPMSLQSQVVVYYFHGNARCPSCYKLEQYAKEAVEQNFSQEMKTGKLVFKRVNIEQSGNDHFVYDYQLYTKSVVISLVKDGKQVRYKNLEKVWDLLKDPNRYHEYIRDEVRPFLGEM